MSIFPQTTGQHSTKMSNLETRKKVMHSKQQLQRIWTKFTGPIVEWSKKIELRSLENNEFSEIS